MKFFSHCDDRYRITRLDQKFFWVETIGIGNILMVVTKVPKGAEKALTIP